MSEETKPEAPAAESTATPEPEGPKWEYKEKFKIHEDMKEVIHLSISASQMELKHLRRKLQKLQYGS